MNIHNQSYSMGINQDLSTNKYPNTNIYWAENFRLVSKDGLATGALTNVAGNNKILSIGSGDEQVKGMCLIRDTLVIFVNSTEGGKIFIWEHTNTDYETDSPKLIYTDPDLDFSQADEIVAVGRYETENIQKVYFTDGVSFFKHLNIVHPTLGLGGQLDYDVDSLDLVSDIDFNTISLELSVGGDLKAGKIQYAYQLYSKRGSESMFSPTSQLIHLTEYTESGDTTDYKGSEVGTSINKSVIVTIDDIDPGDKNLFTRLRLVALEYTVFNQIPNIRIVGEYNVENLTSLTVVDNGSSIGELTLEEFRFIQNNFYPKSIDIKNDYLFAANVKHDYFYINDSDFDTRTFRFNSYGVCKIYNGNNEAVVLSDWSNLPAITDECYNKFNDWTNDYNNETGSVTTYHYKYQSDGVTLGGEGPNISYKFVTTRVLLDDAQVDITGWAVGNDDNPVPKQDIACSEFTNYCNPLTPVGLKRDEVYRYGIVLKDTKGRESFAKWIGDIRTPNNKELPFIYYDSATNKVYADILGIEFTVNTSSISNQISGYRIVRVERTKRDRTILTQGLLGYMKAYSDDEYEEDMMFSLGTLPYITDCVNKKVMLDLKSQYGGESNRRYVNKDALLTDDYMEFFSPEIVVNKENYDISNAHIEVEGYLTDADTISTSGPNQPNVHMLVSNKYWNYGAPTTKYRKDIEEFKIYSPKLRGHHGSDYTLDSTLYQLTDGITFNNMCNTGNSGEDQHYRGARGTFGLIKTDGGFPIATGDTGWTGGTANRVFVANYRVNKGRAIYGGTTWEARTNNKYYAASEFIPKTTTVSNVYGGDTYINYMWYLRSMWDFNWGDYDNNPSDPGVSNRSIENIIMFPVESSINLDLRLDKPQKYMNWGYARREYSPNYKLLETVNMGTTSFARSYPTELGNLYRYNSAYSCIDKSKEYYPEPFDFEETIINDTRIYASEKKFNGEYIDQWTKFKFNNYIDVDSKHNSITKIVTFKDNLFYFQPTAVGIASVNERSLIQDNQAKQLSLGTGGILTRYDYITDKSGSAFYNGIIATDDYLFYVDGQRKRINKLVPGKEVAVSIVKGIDSTLDKLPFTNIRVGFDRGYNEVIFSIDNTTLAFSESADCFFSSYSFNPGRMISIGGDFYSTFPFDDESPWLYADLEVEKVGYSGTDDSDPTWDYIIIGPGGQGEGLWKHNIGNPGEFYGGDGGADDSTLTLIINPNQNMVCYFDNLDLRTESTDSNNNDVPDDIFYRLEASNNYQEISKELSFTLNQNQNTGSVKRIGRIWRTSIMPSVPSGVSASRMVDTYLKITLRYDNSSGNKFRVHDTQIYYRPAKH